MVDTPKVVLCVDTSYGVRRDLLFGISRYVRRNGPWKLDIEGGNRAQILSKLKVWDGQGIIASMHDDRVAQAVIDADVSTVALCLSEDQRRRAYPLSRLPDVSFDAAEDVARLAVDHFLEREFRHCAFVGLADMNWSALREAAFVECVEKAGLACHVYHPPSRQANRVWENEHSILTEWISSIPKPVGILTCNDERGRQVLEACRLADAAVPEDVAVLGVDNDETFCSLADPPLSSIVLDAETAGYSAAALLDGMMRGGARKNLRVRVRATRVVTRRSTDIFAVDDSDVSQALQFIRKRQGREISVADVAEEVALSRRSLEKRFLNAIGRTVHEEIQRARLQYAKQLLIETGQSISEVAAFAGFSSTGSFVRFFRTRVGASPADFRGNSMR